MASLYTLYKNVVGALVAYAEVDLGAGSDGTSRRMPRSTPSDETGAAWFAPGNPAHVTLDAQAAGLSTAAGQSTQVTQLQALVAALGGTLSVNARMASASPSTSARLRSRSPGPSRSRTKSR